MTRSVEFSRLARRDVAQAYLWYEGQRPGLGADLLAELGVRLGDAAEHPNHYPIFHRDARRFLLRRFPYAVAFRD